MSAEPFLDAEQIRTATFVRHVEIHDTLGSTNDRAAELARDSSIELPALVVARQQTAGRGRGRNKWWSTDGALTFSLLLEPGAHGLSTVDWPQLSLATAVAVCDALQTAAPNATIGIKWPNDVMLEGGKVSGILIESPGGFAPAKDRLILGIGINVNNSVPRAAARNDSANNTQVGLASGLCEVTGRIHDLQEVLESVSQAIEIRIGQLASHDSNLPTAWQQLDWLIEQSVEAHSNGRWIDGICVGIDNDGALLIENVFGTHRIHSGSVRVK